MRQHSLPSLEYTSNAVLERDLMNILIRARLEHDASVLFTKGQNRVTNSAQTPYEQRLAKMKMYTKFLSKNHSIIWGISA
jgi:hypothetical protein